MWIDEIKNNLRIAIIGLGYVGMPLAVEFAKKFNVIGYDINKQKINKYIKGIDPTKEVGDDVVKKSNVEFTNDENKLKDANFFIVAVPTPINGDKTPNLSPVIEASKIVGRNMKKNSVIVYESTVYPGVTENICVPILEKNSGMSLKNDFKVGYSPERINPGDKKNRLCNIKKIVSGCDDETLELISEVYSQIINAGVHNAESIKVAEAAKVIENSQRDINIAFMNEIAMVLDKMNISTSDVIKAMNTKWNALGFYPGLVGGHCIGVDPYYLVYEAEMMGYHSQIISASRKINDGMGEYIADAIIKQLILGYKNVRNSKVAILGITFKENCPDIRNSKVIDIIKRLEEYGIFPIVSDPWADVDEVMDNYGVKLQDIEDISDSDCVVVAVAHDEFRKMACDDFDKLFRDNVAGKRIIIDVKSVLNKKEFMQNGYVYWAL